MDDLISRAGITETVGFIAACSYGDPIDAKDVLKAIEEAPTINAEPVRHAAWEHRNNSATCKRIGDFEEWLECSACNAEVDRKYPNCPYCTARMDAKEDAEQFVDTNKTSDTKEDAE